MKRKLQGQRAEDNNKAKNAQLQQRFAKSIFFLRNEGNEWEEIRLAGSKQEQGGSFIPIGHQARPCLRTTPYQQPSYYFVTKA